VSQSKQQKEVKMMSIKSRQRVHAIRMKELNKKHIEGLRNQYKDRGDRSVKELQSDIGITKHYQKMFKHFGQNLDIQRCSFRTKFWITKYLSDISCYCMSNERRQYDESANIDWNCYIQEHIEVIKNKESSLDYLFTDEFKFTKENNIKTLEYLNAKYKCVISPTTDEKLSYAIHYYPNFSYQKFIEGTTIQSIVKSIISVPMTLIRKLILKIKWRKQ